MKMKTVPNWVTEKCLHVSSRYQACKTCIEVSCKIQYILSESRMGNPLNLVGGGAMKFTYNIMQKNDPEKFFKNVFLSPK